MQKISRRWWGAIALGAVLDFGATACSTRKGNKMFDWVEGTKPLEERQTSEDYQAAVEVQLGRFVEQLWSPERRRSTPLPFQNQSSQ